jgi:L-amino acid N-acyltransferase YncA
MVWTPENSECLGWEVDGKLQAGVWYEDMNAVSVMAHIAITGRIGKKFIRAIFDYPFNQMRVEKILCPVLEDNVKSIRLCGKLGFSKTAVLKDIHPSGDMFFYMLERENCKYLGERYG